MERDGGRGIGNERWNDRAGEERYEWRERDRLIDRERERERGGG